MTRPADNKDWTDLVAGYVLGNLSSEEAASLRQQLDDNPALAEEIVAFQETLSLLPYALSTREPSANVKSNLLITASQTESSLELDSPVSPESSDTDTDKNKDTDTKAHPLQLVPNSGSVTSQPHRTKQTVNSWTRWAPRISTSIAAVAIAALGFTQLQLHKRSQQAVVLQQQLADKTAEVASLRNQLQETRTVTAFLGENSTQVHSLIDPKAVVANSEEASDSNTLPSARLLAKAGETEIVFVAQDLPQLSSEQVYRLWAVADESTKPMYCGQFRQDSSGTARWDAPDRACTDGPSQLLITLDAPDDPITSAGPLVLQSDV